MKKPDGGYRLISVVQLVMAWWAYRTRLVRFLDFRVYLAVHEAVARRCGLERGREARYELEELRRLTGARHTGAVRHALRRLEGVGLLRWGRGEVTFAVSPDELHAEELGSFWAMLELVENRKRRVPVPRRTLRLLAGGARRVVAATVLGHLFRCVYVRDGGCTFEGRCKASWVAETFGVAERRVKDARAHLQAIGWLKVGAAPQWLLNRYGAPVVVNLAWEQCGAKFSTTESAPPSAVFTAESAPPDSDQKPPTERTEHQKPTGAGGPATGVSSEKLEQPDLRHLVIEDLKRTDRLLELFGQAAKRGLVDGGDVARLNFVGAAEHALVIGSRNPCGLFAWLLRNRRFEFVTQADEDSAQRRIKELLYGKPEREKEKPRRSLVPALSDDARLVQAVRAALLRRSVFEDPLPHVQRAKPEWTRERWERAALELEGSKRAYAEAQDGALDEQLVEAVA